MATDHSTDETDDFLEYLLRCALTAPGAETSPTAGRILARLLVVGAVESGDELVTPYLVPMPGDEATFEVRAYQPGDLVPTDVRDGLPAAAALKIALRSARESDDGIEVVSRNPSGVERCVLVRDSTGDFEFRFAGPETLVGDAVDVAAARAQWAATLDHWRAGTPAAGASVATASGGRVRATVATAPRLAPVPRAAPDRLDDAFGPPGAAAGPPGPAARPAGAGWWVSSGGRSSEADGTAVPRGVARPSVAGEDSGDGPAESAPSDFDNRPAVSDTDGRAGPSAPPPTAEVAAAGVAAASGAAVGPALTAATDRPPEGFFGSTETPVPGEDALTAAVREAIANLVVEVDLSQVEQLLRRVLEDDHREMVEPLARRLSARLGEALDRPDPAVFAHVLAQVVPHPVDLAEAVAADVGALLSETILRRRAGDGGGGLEAFNLMVGIEQLQVRLDGLQDQLQRSAGLLEGMADHLEAGDRRAAVAERVATSVDQEMQRLANRIDEQVAALAATPGTGSDTAEGVARLTRKLRQSVAQFDRVLERMDAAFELSEPSAGVPRETTNRSHPPSRTLS